MFLDSDASAPELLGPSAADLGLMLMILCSQGPNAADPVLLVLMLLVLMLLDPCSQPCVPRA